MKFPQLNVFAAGFFAIETLAMGWIAAAGRLLLELAGVAVEEGAIPARIVGALLLLAVMVTLWIVKGGALAVLGKSGGNGYRFGHRMVFWANVLAALLFIFPFALPMMSDPNLIMVSGKFTTAFGYWVMAMWAIGFSLLYQSSLPVEKKS